jgi:hypothetical protein
MDEKSKKDADDSSETVVEEKVVETELVDEESTTEQITPALNPKPVPVLVIIGIALVIAIFLVSIILNVSLLSKPDETSALSTFNWIVVISSLLIAGLGLGISFWMYYARTVYLKNGPALVPERWGHILAELGHVTNQANMNTVESLTAVLKASNHQTEKSESLLESFLTLQQAISNRDDEISRLKKGHDAKIFKRFITRFIRVSVALEEIREEAKDSDQAKNYKYLCRLIQNSLEDCGVEQVRPEINSDYREAGPEIADDPTLITTNDSTLDFKIASVESPAYVIEGEGDREIIIPAKVSVYKLEEQEGKSDD